MFLELYSTQEINKNLVTVIIWFWTFLVKCEKIFLLWEKTFGIWFVLSLQHAILYLSTYITWKKKKCMLRKKQIIIILWYRRDDDDEWVSFVICNLNNQLILPTKKNPYHSHTSSRLNIKQKKYFLFFLIFQISSIILEI